MPSDLFCISRQSDKKKISPPRGERRLNCCDTALAQNLPRRQWRRKCEKGDAIPRRPDIKSCAAVGGWGWGERRVCSQKIMSKVYDEHVNSSEIIAFEPGEGNSHFLKPRLRPLARRARGRGHGRKRAAASRWHR